MQPKFAPADAKSIPLFVVETAGLEEWLKTQSDATQNWVAASGFTAGLGAALLLPDADGDANSAVVGWGAAKERKRGRFHLATVARNLPEGVYHIESGLRADELDEAALGWLFAGYKFDRYKAMPEKERLLVAPKGVDAARLEAIAAADFLTRDLINTPTSDLGPDALEAAFLALARKFGAVAAVVKGQELLDQNFPVIHAVGRASDQEPRLLDLRWGDESNPTVTLVGKGVCFDTGGLNIKPGASMGLMKKDMGGAATVMGLAHMIMALNLPVRLRVLVPAVENSISAGAFRPGDVLTSRKGLTIEVNNTDAEGRLVLADALAFADEEKPDLMLCMATLTGAARVALGPDVPPFYTDDDKLAGALSTAAKVVADPLWRMPFWDAYEPMIEPDIADVDNAPKGGFAGSITAALFLRRFVENTGRFVHFDIYGVTPSDKPGRPKGGVSQGARAAFEMIAREFGG